MKRKRISIPFFLFVAFYMTYNLSAGSEASEAENKSGTEKYIYKQSDFINELVGTEKNQSRRDDITGIISYIDDTYMDLYPKLKSGGKITIFFDPAHGILKSGHWQGNVTWRQSAESLPEEFYSLSLSRKLYSLLKNNKFINVISSDDYILALEGVSENYNNLPFSKTIALAKANHSFMIISSHLNNIAPVWKADGVTNIPGIQITCDKYGRQLLTEVKTTYKGYLTLYNKLDSSGFSYDVATNFRNNMIKNDYTPNNWDYGAVAYDRFSFFYDFPISIIFESGFISNPEEEKMLRTESVQNTIALSQYQAIVNSVKTRFGLDISGTNIKKTSDYNTVPIDALKLSRLAIYYIRKTEIQKAINICLKLESDYKDSKAFKVDPYIEIRRDLVSIRDNMKTARNYRKKKWTKTARSYYFNAITTSKKSPIYYNLKYAATKEYNELTSRKLRIGSGEESSGSYSGHPPVFAPLSLTVEKHSYNTPYIFIFDSSDTLKSAVERSITSNPEKVSTLVKKFTDAKIVKYKWQKYYSQKNKKYKWKQVKTEKKISFTKGIFVLKLDKNMNITSFEKVSQVSFNPKKYQNQLFFKNSYLAEKIKNRLL